jgi:hypothetical protein
MNKAVNKTADMSYTRMGICGYRQQKYKACQRRQTLFDVHLHLLPLFV